MADEASPREVGSHDGLGVTVDDLEALARSGGLKGPADAWTTLRSAIENYVAGKVLDNRGYRQIGFMAFGAVDGLPIALCEYTGPTELAVFGKVLDAARREGFVGTASERMLELGWTIRPIYAADGLTPNVRHERP